MGKAWKQLEKSVAEKLKGMKMGGTRKDLPDVVTIIKGYVLIGECKHSKNFPAWVSNIFEEALSKVPYLPAEFSGNVFIPVGVLKPKGMHDEIILIKMSDFIKLTRVE